MELHLEPFPLLPLISDVAKTIEPMATKNGNRIVVDCPPDLGTMHADQTSFDKRCSIWRAMPINSPRRHRYHRGAAASGSMGATGSRSP